MIQSQINRNIRLDLADAILLSKAKKISHLPRLPTAPVWQKPL
ncbi:cyanate hydratase [Escherichia coli]|uniref:Cyanate hydratase n=1 Tax=Escherichia coli TaxID=562 RepID=A0A376YF02_ECOLX|nr:cyanate hydratase [Escherichia coli]